MAGELKVTLRKSTIGSKPKARGTVRALGLRRINHSVVLPDRPEIRGIDWQSPVAQQYDLHSIPHFKVYSPAGKLLAEDKIVFGPDGRPDRALSSNAGRQMVDQWINALDH